VDYVIDLRFSTWMPLYYRPNNLRELLKNKGVAYKHLQKLGNPSRLRKKALEEAKIVQFNKEVSVFNFQNAKRIKQGKKPKSLEDGIDQEEWEKDVQGFRNQVDKKAFWRGRKTKALKEWMTLRCIDQEKMDNLAKKYYLDYIENNKELLGKIIKLIKNNNNMTFCFICSCNTQNEAKCHRFWLRERINELY
jgi:hypothetical protein